MDDRHDHGQRSHRKRKEVIQGVEATVIGKVLWHFFGHKAQSPWSLIACNTSVDPRIEGSASPEVANMKTASDGGHHQHKLRKPTWQADRLCFIKQRITCCRSWKASCSLASVGYDVSCTAVLGEPPRRR